MDDVVILKCCIFPCPLPSNMGHFDALTGQDLHTIFEPLSCDLIIRHLALEHGLVGRLDCQISNVLQHLQLFFCRRVGVGGKKRTKDKSSDRSA